MPILTGTNIRHTFGQRILLDGVSVSIEPDDRIGVVGRNGTGKSTLLKILAGLVTPDAGTVALTKGARAGYLRQEPVFDPDETLRSAAEAAFATLHELHRRLDRVFHQMETAEGEALDKLLKQQERLEREMEAAGGYAIDHKIEAVLHGLGFVDAQFSTPVTGLSGGQKSRLALAQLLLSEPDVLLLDEPTNHLDIEGRLWLEDFLKNEYRGAVVLISHDRYLLDRVVGKIVEVEAARLIDYPGNYAAFREIRAQRRLSMLRAYENQQTKFKKEQAFIDRYRAGQRAKQAQGRETRLDRQRERDTLERPMEVEAFRLELPKADRTGEIVVAARGISKSYTGDDGREKVLFRELDLTVGRGERWGIIGPNGAGKSTLVRTLLKEQESDTGTVKVGSNVKVGHFTQTHEHLDGSMQVYRYLQHVILKEAPGQQMSEQQARDLAGAFLFSGEQQERELGTLSGGERARAVLAGLLASAKNLLVLDEPTNHLDIPSAERLEDALQPPDEEQDRGGYEGVLILISHDRALIDATCDHLIVLDGKGDAEIFHGNYTAWREKDLQRKREAAQREADEARRREDAEKARRAGEEARKRQQAAARAAPPPTPAAPGKPRPAPSSNPLAKLRTEQIEERIAKIEARLKQIDADLADAAVWRDPVKCQSLGEERTRLAAELEPLEYEYFSRQGA